MLYLSLSRMLIRTILLLSVLVFLQWKQNRGRSCWLFQKLFVLYLNLMTGKDLDLFEMYSETDSCLPNNPITSYLVEKYWVFGSGYCMLLPTNCLHYFLWSPSFWGRGNIFVVYFLVYNSVTIHATKILLSLLRSAKSLIRGFLLVVFIINIYLLSIYTAILIKCLIVNCCFLQRVMDLNYQCIFLFNYDVGKHCI